MGAATVRQDRGRHGARPAAPAPGASCRTASSSARVTVDRAQLAAYDRVCGFRLGDALPATYPHVLAFPLAMELMAARDFPFGVLGLVHVANAIEQLRPLDAGEPLELRVWAENLAAHPRGRTIDLVAEASAGGAVAWRDRSTYLHRERAGRKAGRSRARGPRRRRPARSGACPGDIGRRYAAVSGDRNPIHLQGCPARAARPAARDRARHVDDGALPRGAAGDAAAGLHGRGRVQAAAAAARDRRVRLLDRGRRAPLRAARRAQRQAAPRPARSRVAASPAA